MFTVLFVVLLGAPEIPRMSLAEVIRAAHDNSPQVRAALADVDAREAQTHVPRTLWYPTAAALVQAIAATSNNSTAQPIGNPFVELPRVGATVISTDPRWGPNATTLAAIGVRQQLYDFGRISSQSALADKERDSERARADAVVRDAVFYAAMAYYDVLGARAVAQASAQAVERASALRDFVVAGIDRGLRPRIERERVEADLQRFEAQRIRSEGALANARANLAAAIGSSSLEVDASDAIGTQVVGDTPNVEQAVALAEPTDPSLREARLRVEAQHESVGVARSQRYPSLYLTGALSGRNGGADPSSGETTGGNGFVPNVPNWSVGVVLQVPLFDANLNAKVDAALAAENALRARADAVRVGVVANAARTVRDLAIAREALPALQRAEAASKSNYAQADARYRAGLGTSVELADAEALRVDAEIQYVLGVQAVARAHLAVLRALSEQTAVNGVSP